MIICIGEERYEVEELIRQVEFDIVDLESIIEKLIRYKELKASTLKLLKNF